MQPADQLRSVRDREDSGLAQVKPVASYFEQEVILERFPRRFIEFRARRLPSGARTTFGGGLLVVVLLCCRRPPASLLFVLLLCYHLKFTDEVDQTGRRARCVATVPELTLGRVAGSKLRAADFAALLGQSENSLLEKVRAGLAACGVQLPRAEGITFYTKFKLSVRDVLDRDGASTVLLSCHPRGEPLFCVVRGGAYGTETGEDQASRDDAPSSPSGSCAP